MRLITARWVLLVLALLAVSLGLPGCGNSTEESSSSASIVLGAQFPDGTTEQDKTMVLDAAILTIERRLTAYGVTDPVVKKQGGNRILVKVKNVSSVDAVVELIERPAYLEFAEVEMNGSSPATVKDYVDGNRTELINKDVPGSRMFYVTGSQSPTAILYEEGGGLQFVDKDSNPIDPGDLGEDDKLAISWMPAVGEVNGVKKALTGAYLTKAFPAYLSQDECIVALEWSDEGAEILSQVALRVRGRPAPQNALGIILDYDLISRPEVTQLQYEGKTAIFGDFTSDEARLLAIQLQSGCLPVDFEVVNVSVT